jgi:hypothetical protein
MDSMRTCLQSFAAKKSSEVACATQLWSLTWKNQLGKSARTLRVQSLFYYRKRRYSLQIDGKWSGKLRSTSPRNNVEIFLLPLEPVSLWSSSMISFIKNKLDMCLLIIRFALLQKTPLFIQFPTPAGLEGRYTEESFHHHHGTTPLWPIHDPLFQESFKIFVLRRGSIIKTALY